MAAQRVLGLQHLACGDHDLGLAAVVVADVELNVLIADTAGYEPIPGSDQFPTFG
jgi:hypothetical protein